MTKNGFKMLHYLDLKRMTSGSFRYRRKNRMEGIDTSKQVVAVLTLLSGPRNTVSLESISTFGPGQLLHVDALPVVPPHPGPP